jgi:uncharacterized membrane protein
MFQQTLNILRGADPMGERPKQVGTAGSGRTRFAAPSKIAERPPTTDEPRHVMNWLQRYWLRRFARSSLLLFPGLCALLALLAALLARWLDRLTGWTVLNYSVDGARALMGAFTASLLTFIVFVLSSLLIVVQLASAQLTPRIIATMLSSRLVKVTLGIFTFAYVCSLAALARVDEAVPQLLIAVAIVSNLACVGVFFVFAQQLGAALRPIAVLQRMATEGRTVIEHVYPRLYAPKLDAVQRSRGKPPPAAEVIEHTGTSGVFLAFGSKQIVHLARAADGVVEIVPQVGDFVAKGDPLFRVASARRPLDAHALRQCAAIGPERTLEQDPRFAFRILVDIANKALSPAINDPTTAVLALDHIHRLLLYVGRRLLDDGEVRDATGALRLVYGTPDWVDYVSLAVSEIRHYGTGSMQVARRLRALLEHLIHVLPDARHAPLRQQLDLLLSSVQRGFLDEQDRCQAAIGDYQGIGGSESEP